MEKKAKTEAYKETDFSKLNEKTWKRLITLITYPNVPLTVLQRKWIDGAEVHVANPKSHS